MNTEVNFAGIKMKNPVTVASGTFGYGREYSQFFDLSKLGGIITKGTSLKPRDGNKPSRVYETASGMLNSIGLQNPGVEYFLQYDLPWLKQQNTAVIVNACGSTIEDYVEVCKILNKADIDGVELNIRKQIIALGGEVRFSSKLEYIKSNNGKIKSIIVNGDEIVDEVLVSYFKAPKSYTAENMCEINSHGGIVVMNKILDLCIRNGAEIAEPGEFTKRAFLNGRMDLSQAEAVIDVINAKTDKEAKISLEQLEGNLSEKITKK